MCASHIKGCASNANGRGQTILAPGNKLLPKLYSSRGSGTRAPKHTTRRHIPSRMGLSAFRGHARRTLCARLRSQPHDGWKHGCRAAQTRNAVGLWEIDSAILMLCGEWNQWLRSALRNNARGVCLRRSMPRPSLPSRCYCRCPWTWRLPAVKPDLNALGTYLADSHRQTQRVPPTHCVQVHFFLRHLV